MQTVTLSEAINYLNDLVNGIISRAEANDWGSKVLVGFYNNLIIADPPESEQIIDDIATLLCQYNSMESPTKYIMSREDLLFWIKDDGFEVYLRNESISDRKRSGA